MKVTLGDITVGFWKIYWWNSLLEMGINVNMCILPFKDLYVNIIFLKEVSLKHYSSLKCWFAAQETNLIIMLKKVVLLNIFYIFRLLEIKILYNIIPRFHKA